MEDDAVHVNMGGDWIMPTKEDLEELYNNTTRKIISINDKKGILFTSNNNRKSIFIVFAGCWNYVNGQFYFNSSYGWIRSSDVNQNDSEYVWLLYLASSGNCFICCDTIDDAYSVRGVLKQKSPLEDF